MSAVFEPRQPDQRRRHPPLHNLLAIAGIMLGILLLRIGFDGVFSYETDLSKLRGGPSTVSAVWSLATGALLILAALTALMPNSPPD